MTLTDVKQVAPQGLSVNSLLKCEVKDVNNKKTEMIFDIIDLHTQLIVAAGQQLERLQALDLRQFADEPEYYESEYLDGNVLKDLGLDRYDGNIPEYVLEYATAVKQEPNDTTSITSIKAAINELKNLISADSTFTFENLSRFSETKLETLRDQMLNLINQFNNYYPHVGVKVAKL